MTGLAGVDGGGRAGPGPAGENEGAGTAAPQDAPRLCAGSAAEGTASSGSLSTRSAAPSAERALVVAHRLPLRMRRAAADDQDAAGHGWTFELDEDSLLMQARGGLAQERLLTSVFIGTLPEEVAPFEQKAVAADLAARFSCVPVFLERELTERFYRRFCKEQLWPVMHYVLPLAPGSAGRFDTGLWQAYIAAAKRFSDKVMEVLSPEDDFVWVHDYHLMLLPSFLRKRFHAVRCGFFLHSPFPSSEIFRAFPEREAVLRGLLNADIVGFHTFDYARHFLSCCTRMLGLKYATERGSLSINYYGRPVRVKICPIGVNPERWRTGFEWPETLWRRGELKAQFDGQTVLLGVDDIDPFKGVELKLLAFEHVLEAHPEWRGRLVLVQIANPPRSAAPGVQALVEEIRGISTRINATFGNSTYMPVVLLERFIPLHELIALYSIADSVVVTATRDGMNLVPYEYIACREGPDGSSDLNARSSCMVVSEFVGCSPSLSGAIRVNPWNMQDLADGIFRAITMPPLERQLKHDKHWRYVREHTVEYWAASNIADLRRVTGDGRPAMQSYGIGFGMNFRVVSLDPDFKRLEVADVLPPYTAARRRLLIFNYVGSLASRTSMTALPSLAVLTLLRQLAADERNLVYIVSGSGKDDLLEWFGDVRGLGFAAEHGFYMRGPEQGAEWELQLPGANEHLDWKQCALPILQMYTESTDGAYIDVKDSAVVWNYADADPEFGSLQAKELVDHLESVLANDPVEVTAVEGAVEVKAQGASKSLALHALLDGVVHDFLLVVGDDTSDEEMFSTLNDMPALPEKTFTCTVGGSKPSKAKTYLHDVSDVIELLQQLATSQYASRP